ncbi:hypothetical protein [Streptomyces sp. NPDC090025]|uniref:hypothetical protein n=1 Tax=Streptomyces sp. NPDC090025 TaxID=3365922 RepID=UPI0038391A8C
MGSNDTPGGGKPNGGKPGGGKAPEAKTTPLDGLSNEQLVAMLTPIQHERATSLSLKLKTVADKITAIAEHLEQRGVRKLDWSGAGAESFLEWTSETAKATHHLGSYAQLASECLARSAEAMAVARGGVDEIAKTSTSSKADYETAKKVLNAARHDPGAGKTDVKDATTEMNAAAGAREKARIEALMKLRSLAQTYTFEGSRVNDAQRPVFPPPAGYLGEDWVRPEREYIEVPGNSEGRPRRYTTKTVTSRDTGGVRPDTTTDHRLVPGSDGDPRRPGVDPTRPGSVRPEVPVDLGIDSVITRPDTPTVPPTTPTGPGPGPGTMKPEQPSYPGGVGAIPPTFTKGPSTVPPPLPITGGTAKGIPPLRPGPIGPVGPGGSVGALPPRAPQQPGIVGGRPVPPTAAGRGTAIPRGTVIGQEPTTGRPGMGGAGAMGPHAGSTPGAGTGNGRASGRRLATEQGGVVGGRPQRNGTGTGRPFTPGGTGLVRPGDDEEREERGRRPEYLVEDEETWQQRGRRPTVPPVVD